MEPLPDDVARFMQDHIETIDQLEILRVLGEDRAKEWDSTALAREVQGEPQAIRAHLAAMHARGLITMVTREAGPSSRFGARTPELEGLVNRLLQVYKQRPVTMIKLVYERAKDPLLAFADAFRIRKEH